MESLEDLKKLLAEVWETDVMGLNIGELMTALGILVLFLLLRGVFTTLVIGRIKKFTEKTETTLDDRLFEALEKPISFVPIILGLFFASGYLNLAGTVGTAVYNLIKSLVIFVIFWGLFNAVEPLSGILNKLKRMFSAPMVVWLKKAIKAAIVFVGAAAILETWGIEVGPVLAGLGLFGAAVALGAQDMFKNLIGGLTVIAEKRFSPGDWIRVEGIVEGTVEDIGFRSTRVRRFDKAPVQVPNAQLADSAVTNFSQMTHRRIYWIIGVEYRTTTEQLKQIRDRIFDYVTANDDFASADDVPTFVRIDSFNNSSIDIMLYCFTKTTVWGEWLEIKEHLAYKIKEIVENAGTAFAFPSQSVYIEALPEGTPEVFQPPH